MKQPKTFTRQVYETAAWVLIICILLFALLFPKLIKAQEVGIQLGGIDALTDLGGNKGIGQTFIKDVETKQAHFSFALSASKSYDNWQFGLQYTHGALSGNDSIQNRGGAEWWRIRRGNVFFTSLNELIVFSKRYFGYGLRPCLSAGVGVFRFENKKTVVRLQPLVYYAVGLNWTINENVQLESSAAGRMIFTDYLDSFSDKDYSKGNDQYLTLSIGIILTGLFRTDANYLKCPKTNFY